MDKKGEIWISAALYFGLGIIVITLILTAGMPVINKLQDRNTIIQTKDLMFILDNNIRDAINGGPGGQRYVEMEIKKGEFRFNNKENTVNWTFESRSPYSQEGVTIEEGSLNIITRKSNVVGKNFIDMSIDYGHMAIPVDIEYTNPSQTIQGYNKLLIKNAGITSDDEVNITITNL